MDTKDTQKRLVSSLDRTKACR